MDVRKDLLLKSAARLYSLGMEVEFAQEKLRGLVESGVPYSSKEMRTAFKEYSELDRAWKELEQQYLALRDEIIQDERGQA